MSQFATTVVRLIEDLRRMTMSDDKREAMPPNTASDDSRPPKRPWEDLSRDDPNHLGHSEVRRDRRLISARDINVL